MDKIALFVNQKRDTDLSATKEVIAFLNEHNKTVFLDSALKEAVSFGNVNFVSGNDLYTSAEILIVLGGDGTILKVAQNAAKFNLPIVGINLGHLGFLTQIERDDIPKLNQVLNGEFVINRHMMLTANIIQNDKVSAKYTALNDIILRSASAKMISLDVTVDKIATNKYSADGIIVSTSTGSTAYSLSCGGPIVHQGLDCMILTPICPHTLKTRCIVIAPDSTVALCFDPSYCSDAELKIDGIAVKSLCIDEHVEVVRSETEVSLISLNSENYFDIIRKKLSD